jgi:VCBS repeat-containing protein
LRLDNIDTDKVTLTVEVTDGDHTDTTTVDIAINDVNDRSPIFERQVYEAAIPGVNVTQTFFLRQ